MQVDIRADRQTERQQKYTGNVLYIYNAREVSRNSHNTVILHIL
jgi:hypothetical protein